MGKGLGIIPEDMKEDLKKILGKGLGITSEEDIKVKDLKKVLEKGLYPCVGLQSQDGSVEVNFGHRKFKYTGNLFLTISAFFNI